MARLLRLALAWMIAVLGGFFAVAGAVLASLGGRPGPLVHQCNAGLLRLMCGAALIFPLSAAGRAAPRGWRRFTKTGAHDRASP